MNSYTKPTIVITPYLNQKWIRDREQECRLQGVNGIYVKNRFNDILRSLKKNNAGMM
jgi:hypothetical protein